MKTVPTISTTDATPCESKHFSSVFNTPHCEAWCRANDTSPERLLADDHVRRGLIKQAVLQTLFCLFLLASLIMISLFFGWVTIGSAIVILFLASIPISIALFVHHNTKYYLWSLDSESVQYREELNQGKKGYAGGTFDELFPEGSHVCPE